MKKRTTLVSFCGTLLLSAAVVYGCGDDDDTVAPKADSGTTSSSGDTGTTSSSGDTGADTNTTPPPPPTLGTQLDRFGRPAINTAANNVFNTDAGAAGAAKDGYNADGVQSGWVAKYTGEAAKNLAIYDALDVNCGNQAFAGATAVAGRYNTLAGVLADDRQWLNTGSTTCSLYLGVEANATGAAPNTDCGGRKLSYDVIDVTYTVVAIGISLPPPVGDGIAKVDAKTDGTTFPYLAAAQ